MVSDSTMLRDGQAETADPQVTSPVRDVRITHAGGSKEGEFMSGLGKALWQSSTQLGPENRINSASEERKKSISHKDMRE